jgi:hypothetical protein
MKREREQQNRVYVVIAGMDLGDEVGSFLLTDEEVASLKPIQMSVPSEREEAVAKGDAEVQMKIFRYTSRDDGTPGLYEHGTHSKKNKVDFDQMMEEPGRTLLFYGWE